MVTVDQFLDFIGHLLLQEPQFDLPKNTGKGFAGLVQVPYDATFSC